MISDGNLSPGFLQSIAGTAPATVYFQSTKDVFWNSLPAADPQATLVKQFHDDYVKQEKAEPGLGSGSGHDAVLLLAQAAQKAGSTDRAKLADALTALDGVQGVFGTYHLSKDNHVGLTASDTLLGQVSNGQIALAH
jgi:branched-chain amino acid transport system substrate-binding protein